MMPPAPPCPRPTRSAQQSASQRVSEALPTPPRHAIFSAPATPSPLARLSAHDREINTICGCTFERERPSERERP
jgi:hypothetical protein